MEKKNTVIVCIGGKARHGKDETARAIKRCMDTHGGVKCLITHQADLLKHIARTMFDWDGKKDEAGRRLLQQLGTDVFRKKDPNYWVDHLVRTFKVLDGAFDFIIIPDTRFPNEIEEFKKAGFHTVYLRVTRPNFVSPLTPEQQAHASETALDQYPFDMGIVNNGTLQDLYHDAAKIAHVLIDLRAQER